MAGGNDDDDAKRKGKMGRAGGLFHMARQRLRCRQRECDKSKGTECTLGDGGMDGTAKGGNQS